MLHAIRFRRQGLGRMALLVYLLTWFAMAVEPCVAALPPVEPAHGHAGHDMARAHHDHGPMQAPAADHTVHCPTGDCVLADALPAPVKADTGSSVALPVLLSLLSYPLFDDARAGPPAPPLVLDDGRLPPSHVLAFRVLLI